MRSMHRLFSTGATFIVLLSATTSALFLSGCAGMTGSSTSATTTVQAIQMSGSVHGGQQPITGGNVYLYAAYDANGAFYAQSPSTSLLTNVNTDGNGNGYVTTDENGDFTLPAGSYTCPASNTSVDTYMLVTGGNPGLLPAGTSNSAITLIAALGPCSNLSASTFVDINEASTVAAVTALQQFMADATHIGSPPNLNGIQNAFTTIPNLVDLASGSALSNTPGGNGTAPQTKLNTLANILSSCVNTSGPTSTGCAALFSAATPPGGTAATNVLSAMLQIAQNPGNNVTALYNLGGSIAAFQPALTAVPNDFTLGITYTGGGLVNPGALAVDYQGNIYTTNCPSCTSASGTDSIVGFSPNGTLLTGATGLTNGIHKPQGIAFDPSDYIWSTNLASGATPDQITRTDESGNLQSGFPFSSGSLGSPLGIAIDASYNAWVADNGSNNVVEVAGSGSLSNTITGNSLSKPTGIGIDGFGNIYATSTGSSSIVKMNSSGTVLSGAGGYAGAGISSPKAIAVDGGEHVWAVDSQANAISEIFGYDGTADSGSSGYTGGIYSASGISIDGAGTAWVSNCRAGCAGSGSTAADNVLHFSTTGANLDVSDGYQNSSLAAPGANIVDPAGNLWISNTTGASLTELVGVASPVIPNLSFIASYNLLPAANLLLNPGFEDAPQGSNIPDWTLSSGNGDMTVAYTEGGAHTGNNRLTEYSGSYIQATVYQTLSVPNGNYLVACWVQGAGQQTTAELIASGYNSGGSQLTYNVQPVIAANQYNWNLVSIPNVPVSTGTLTVGMYDYSPTPSTSGNDYLSWDDCSVTKQ